MSLFNPRQLTQEIDNALPGLALIGVAMVVSDALTEGDFKPLADLAGDLLEAIFE